MNHSLKCLSLLLMLIVASCTNITTSITPEASLSRKPNPDEGYIVGIFDIKKPLGVDKDPGMVTGYSMFGSGVNGSSKTSIKFSDWGHSSSKIDDISIYTLRKNPAGIFVIPVKAGEYSINGWMMSAYGYGGSLTIKNTGEMNVPFNVEAGSATYIGRANVVTRYGKNLFRMPILGDGIILLSNNYNTDKNTIIKEFPALKKVKIKNASLEKLYLQQIEQAANDYANKPWYTKLIQ